MNVDERKDAVAGLYGELEVLLINLAGIHRSIAMHYRADSIAHTEHSLQARAADLVAEYWAASAPQHLPDLTSDKLIKEQTRALARGDSLIQIDGSILDQQLEAFMWDVLKAIRVKANGSS